MYTIILVSSFFLASGKPATVESQQTFLTKEACTLMANKMTAASGLVHQCVALKEPRSI